MKLGDTCKFCLRPITRKVLEEKRAVKVANALASLAKAKARGNKIGRKKIRDDDEIRRLRKEGKTIREIATIQGVSTTAVQQGLRAK